MINQEVQTIRLREEGHCSARPLRPSPYEKPQVASEKIGSRGAFSYSIFLRASSNIRWARDGLNTPQEQNLAM
jgi:hypothetical protein